jgi:sugar diacid utilization regulator
LQITSFLGQEIIERVAKYTEVDINIMNLNGKIVSSTDESRIGDIHTGALEVLKTEVELIIDEKGLVEYPGTKPGVNLPIKHNRMIAGVVGVSGTPEDIYKFTGLIRSAVEVVMEQLHTERQGYFRDRQWSYWLQQLLHPSGFNKEKLEEDADYLLNVNIYSDWRVLVICGELGNDVLETIRREITNTNLDVLFTLPFSESEIIITFPATFERMQAFVNMLKKITGSVCRIGIGENEFGVTGLRNSYMQAKQALSFAGEEVSVSFSADWRLERLIAAIEEREYKSVCYRYEQSLEKLDNIYFDTIDLFLHMNLSIKKTAEHLHVHRNTLLYRLDQIHKKVGLNPRSFHDACILRTIRRR